MPQSLDSNLQEILDEALKRDCPRVIPDARAISTIMLEDGQTLDMLGAYYSMNLCFDVMERTGSRDRELGPFKLVEVIKPRNPGYDKLTFQICTAMYHLSSHSSFEEKYPNSCRGGKWRAVGDAVNGRGYCWDHTNEDEMEAVSIYRKMVEKVDLGPRLYDRMGALLA